MNRLYVAFTLAFRMAVLIIVVTAGVAFIFAGARSALAANLKNMSVITDNVLTVGDIFDGLSADKAAHVLGPAPQPGQEMVLNARTLMRVAMALDLPWRPGHSGEQIVIKRAATIISTEDIKHEISRSLREKGVDGKFALNLGGQMPQMILPASLPARFDITQMRYDPISNRFDAAIAAPSEEAAVTRLDVTGRVERLVPVPVVIGSINNGNIIQARDINWIDLRAEEIQHDTILEAEDLIGMTPRRIIMAGKPVLAREVEKPEIVQRGEAVTILYQRGRMTLTAMGKALENGAYGDVIRIVNMDSSQSIQGIVTAERTVTVR